MLNMVIFLKPLFCRFTHYAYQLIFMFIINSEKICQSTNEMTRFNWKVLLSKCNILITCFVILMSPVMKISLLGYTFMFLHRNASFVRFIGHWQNAVFRFQGHCEHWEWQRSQQYKPLHYETNNHCLAMLVMLSDGYHRNLY